MKNTLIFGILATSLSVSFASNIPQVRDDVVYQTRNSISNKCSALLKNKQFDELEIFLDKLDNDKELLNSYGESVTSYCLKQTDTDAISNWIKTKPNSKYAKLSMYQKSIDQFFQLRGNDFIRNTDPQRIKSANDFLDIRSELMEPMKKLGTTRAWYEKRIEIAFYQSDKKIFFNILDEAAQKYPDHFPIYAIASYNMSPVWGWSYEVLNNLALFASKKSGDDSIYARVYMAQINTLEFDEIQKAGHLDKKLFLNGMKIITEKHPTTYNYNYYAMAACKLNEKELTKDIINNKMKKFLVPEWIPKDLIKCIEYVKN